VVLLKKHLKWLIPAFFIVVALIYVLYTVWAPSDKHDKNDTPATESTSNETNDNPTLDTTQTPKGKVTLPKKAHVFLVKNNEITLASTDKVDVTTGTLNDKLPKDTRFVLIPASMHLTDAEKSHLQAWVKEKVIVLFFGADVQPKDVLGNLNVEPETNKLQASVPLYYFAYGYGYSYGYKGNVRLFGQTQNNTLSNESIANSLAQLVYDERGF